MNITIDYLKDFEVIIGFVMRRRSHLKYIRGIFLWFKDKEIFFYGSKIKTIDTKDVARGALRFCLVGP